MQLNTFKSNNGTESNREKKECHILVVETVIFLSKVVCALP